MNAVILISTAGCGQAPSVPTGGRVVLVEHRIDVAWQHTRALEAIGSAATEDADHLHAVGPPGWRYLPIRGAERAVMSCVLTGGHMMCYTSDPGPLTGPRSHTKLWPPI
jgi:hypothetical protein